MSLYSEHRMLKQGSVLWVDLSLNTKEKKGVTDSVVLRRKAPPPLESVLRLALSLLSLQQLVVKL